MHENILPVPFHEVTEDLVCIVRDEIACGIPVFKAQDLFSMLFYKDGDSDTTREGFYFSCSFRYSVLKCSTYTDILPATFKVQVTLFH